MDAKTGYGRSTVYIGVLVIVWVVLFMWLGRKLGMIDLWSVMLIGSALITFFGFLRLPGGIDQDGAFRESRIRLAITATLIVVYLVYFGSVVYLDEFRNEQGQKIESMAQDLMPTLTNLLMVSISFYFGSTAAIEIANTMKKGDTMAQTQVQSQS